MLRGFRRGGGGRRGGGCWGRGMCSCGCVFVSSDYLDCEGGDGWWMGNGVWRSLGLTIRFCC